MTALLRRVLARLLNVVRWRGVERDLADEVAYHLEMAEADYRARGVSAEAARRRALRDFGGERWVEASRSTRGVPWLQDVGRDFRYASRVLRRSPGFTAAVLLVIALGIGATTAVFSVVRGVLLAPLPYGDASRLHGLLEGDSAGAQRPLSYPTFEDVAVAATAVADLAYVRGDLLLARHPDGAMNLLTAFVSRDYFAVMQSTAYRGRVLMPGDRVVAVLSWQLAERLYGDADAALGRTLVTTEHSYEVVGVMPRGFAFPAWADLWIPLAGLPAEARYALDRRDLHVDSDAVVRLKPGITVEQARAILSAPIAHAAATYPEPGQRFDRASITPIRERVIGDVTTRLQVLLGAVVLVLLLTCVNVAGLLIARGLARRDELCARLALGAGRGRLVRQFLTESALLALLGAVPGVLLAYWAVRALKRAAPTLFPRMAEITLDAGVLWFAVGLTLASALVFGALPALRAVGAAVRSLPAGASRSSTADTRTARLRGGLVVAQLAIAVVLLIGATLLLRSAHSLSSLDVGFEPDGLVVLRVFPPEHYDEDAARLALYRELQQSLARAPGVRRSSLVNHVPLSGGAMPTAVHTDRVIAPDENTFAYFRAVSTDYLQTLGARPLRGRLLTDADAYGTGIVVNETLARREWGDADPLGRSITVFRSAQGAAAFGEPLPGIVVGVVADIRERGLTLDPPPTVYVPLERNVWTNINLVVRTERSIAAITPALREAVRAVNPDIPVAGPGFTDQFRALTDYAEQSTARHRFVTALLTGFALIAVILSVIGLFAAMAFLVTQRTRELGIRMALGARPADTAGMVLRHSGTLIVLGLAIGITAAIPASRVLQSLLFGVPMHDALSYAAAVVVLLATGALAAYLPARRAARIDPMVALRQG